MYLVVPWHVLLTMSLNCIERSKSICACELESVRLSFINWYTYNVDSIMACHISSMLILDLSVLILSDHHCYWRELPQVSFLSRQKFVTTNTCLLPQNASFVTTKVCLSRQKWYLWQLHQWYTTVIFLITFHLAFVYFHENFTDLEMLTTEIRSN